MPNIKPVSDLRNYNEVLKDVAIGEPVFLTKNGRGRFVIIDIEEYEKNQATVKLLSKLLEAEKAVKAGNEWLTGENVRETLGL
jgi:prevent-host-death family protein